MDQILIVFGINWKLLLIQGINFGLLLLILWHFLYKPVIKMVDVRRERIAQGIRDAEQSERELGEAEAQKARILREATLKGDALIEAAKKHAEAEEHAIIKEAHRKATHLLNESERRMAREHEEMLQSAEREVARMAVLAAEKILRKA
ncbi:MAG: F0F1 ATP synthase subunit B [Patescibacteria group bacterium]